MSERKVINKYYPPDYDPSNLPRIERKNRPNQVRIMAPFNMRCNTCGNYIANATKFNAKKETIEDKHYEKLLIFRFFIKCPRCMNSIVFRTNPKDRSYEVEHGATENFMSLKMADKMAREEAEAEAEEEKINPMKHLENRTKASKQQMEASEQIQELRSIKQRHRSVDIESLIQEKRREGLDTTLRLPSNEDNKSIHDDDDIRAEAMSLMMRKEIELTESTTEEPVLPEPSNSKVLGPKKLSSALMNLKKKIKVAPKNSCHASNVKMSDNKT